MSTVIFKWNPSFSSYSMLHFLSDIRECNIEPEFDDFNWSVWDYDKIKEGDTYYWLKVGLYGQIGIVGRGVVTSDPYEGEDWSGKGRQTFYVDFKPEVLINPDALPILSSQDLSDVIPDFEWTGGHSGIVLNEQQAEILERLWADYMKQNQDEILRSTTRRDLDLAFVKNG